MAPVNAAEHAVDAVDVRRPFTTVTLALVALVAALAVWAGLAWASGGAVPAPTEVPRVVFTQASDDPDGASDGQRCNKDGRSADTVPAPASL